MQDNPTRELPTFAQHVNGDESTRLTFERARPQSTRGVRSEAGGVSPGYEHARIYTPWERETARRESRIARDMIAGDEWHRKGVCRREGQTARMSCGTCALLGYEPRGGWGDDFKVRRDGPNYAGWPRIYVQAGRPIPAKWRAAFAREVSDNPRYMEALGRDLVTFGHPGFVGEA